MPDEKVPSVRKVCAINNIEEKTVINKCAPSKTFESGSCIPLDYLILMTDAFNKSVESYNKKKHQPNRQNSKIKFEKIDYKWNLNWDDKSKKGDGPSSLIKSSKPVGLDDPDKKKKKYKKYLLMELTKRLKEVCDTQDCWIKQKFISRIENQQKRLDLVKNTFRPDAPTDKNGKKDKNEWLATENINEVMKQYEEKHPDFKFLGAVPIDFDSISDHLEFNIRDMNIPKLKKEGKIKIGAIFNLDPHYESGSHWVGMFVDLDEASIDYFDSETGEPEKEVKILINRFVKYFQKNGQKPVIQVNKKRHQKKGSECGVYSMSFILRRRAGESLEDINNVRVSDELVNQCREVFFK